VIGLTKLAPAGNVALAERPEPAPGPGQVVVEVVGAGICGTDLHIADGEYETVTPVTMGHEVSGVVAEVGAGVESLGIAASTTDDEPVEADVVIECSASEAGMGSGLAANRRGGRHVQMGLAGKPVTLPIDLVCFHELTVTSGFASTPSSWRKALELVGDRRVDLEPLVTEIVPLEEWERAFAATRAAERIKFVLAPT